MQTQQATANQLEKGSTELEKLHHQAGLRQSLMSIDLARAIAALAVFVYHYGVGHVLATATGIEQFNWIAEPGARWAVPLFFAISGYCIHLSEWSYLSQRQQTAIDLGRYATRRFWRIYPPYWFALLFSFAIATQAGETFSGRDLLVHLGMMQSLSSESFNTMNVVLWSVSVEEFLSLIYPAW